MSRFLISALPAALVVFRFMAGPYLLLDAWNGHSSSGFVPVFVLAVLSDIFDGIIARRLNVVSSFLREADSRADLCLYLCVLASIWQVFPDVVGGFALPLGITALAQGLQWGASLIKYGRLASYHSYSAKIWGLSLAVATIALFGFGYAGVTFWATLVIGTLHNLEEVAMTLILPRWTFDVVTIQKALQIRASSLATRTAGAIP
ncbi:CDP-alcohol phosphatidyltransferase family protein [Nodosilinea sp. LEGE 07088]|uniref:CDP-alcohol phosphatidyltransferase family protein n=1 Tax=Nodosilinea sp. LEGE 07088 TaxID=2777968 RepID=UPI00187F62F1|nr:CDP-alcohol phosphatidyltransferase family protein [Nodosilinea sp. LEGE 07088]MBE9140047.1 CDP-alcohol phosphatidyltransferase family protein [Nodosilinea sp. LEGE 07088]